MLSGPFAAAASAADPAAPGLTSGGRRFRAALAALAAALAIVVLAGCGGGATATVEASPAASGTAKSSITAKPGGTAKPSASRSASKGASSAGSQSGQVAPAKATTSLPTVTVSQLPKEAQTTLGLVAAGGPYPYSRDGVVFENREGILPKRSSGYYHEYTVVTPGSNDRGARRIVTGEDGSRFYTDDHYDTFSEVVSG